MQRAYDTLRDSQKRKVPHHGLVGCQHCVTLKHHNASRITSCATLQAYDRMGHEAYENMEAAGGSPGGQGGPFEGSGPFSGTGAQVCRFRVTPGPSCLSGWFKPLRLCSTTTCCVALPQGDAESIIFEFFGGGRRSQGFQVSSENSLLLGAACNAG